LASAAAIPNGTFKGHLFGRKKILSQLIDLLYFINGRGKAATQFKENPHRIGCKFVVQRNKDNTGHCQENANSIKKKEKM
jgi:hypothetical protein